MTITVGWDYARETFFAQVWDDLEHDLELIFWVGFGAKRIQTIEDLNPCLAIFGGEIPEIVEANLRADQVNLSSPSSPQANAKHLRENPPLTVPGRTPSGVHPLLDHRPSRSLPFLNPPPRVEKNAGGRWHVGHFNKRRHTLTFSSRVVSAVSGLPSVLNPAVRS